MEVILWVLGILASLLSGAVGGVLAARPIARRTLAVHRQRAAEDTVVHTLRGYRDLLRHQHDQLYKFDKFPSGYVSLPGQEQLTEKVLRGLHDFPRRKERKTRELLKQLVGPSTLRFVEERLHVPADQLAPEEDKDRLVRALRENASEQTEPGLLRELLRTNNDPSTHEPLYRDALRVLNELIKLVDPRVGSGPTRAV